MCEKEQGSGLALMEEGGGGGGEGWRDRGYPRVFFPPQRACGLNGM